MAEQKQDKSTWNHRVIKSIDEDGTEYLTIQEVYYEEDETFMIILFLYLGKNKTFGWNTWNNWIEIKNKRKEPKRIIKGLIPSSK